MKATPEGKRKHRMAIDPRQLKFPMKLGKFLRLMLPELRGRTAEQGRVWRAFKADYPPGSMWSNGADFGRIMAEFYKTGIPNGLTFFVAAKTFVSWYEDPDHGWRIKETSRQRSIAGKWKRKKRRARPPFEKLGQALGLT